MNDNMDNLFGLKGTGEFHFRVVSHWTSYPENAHEIKLYDGIFYSRIERDDPETMGRKIARHVLRLRAPWFVEFTPNGDAVVYRKRAMGRMATFIELQKNGPVAAYTLAMTL
jgi:hypothetical protein